MQDGEDHIDVGLSARLGQDGPWVPFTVWVDKVFNLFVLGGVHPLHDGFGGTDRDLVLATAAPIHDGYA